MSSQTPPTVDPLSSLPPENVVSPAERSVSQLASLLREFDTTAPGAIPSRIDYEKRLVEVRLGIASGLFAALRHKSAPTAAHSLRVALGCSSWAIALGLEARAREDLEVAALLHDVGKIGAPDRLLLKPGKLAADEMLLMDQYRLAGLDILANCGPSRAVVEIIRYSAAWYNGTRPNYPLSGKDIPQGARMLAIVDAFDSMTTDQVYRRAMSRERAVHELFTYSPVQFDPELVQSFSELQITAQLHRKVVGQWLQTLDPRRSNRFRHNLAGSHLEDDVPFAQALFQQKLLDNMHDAVIFVDRNLRIIRWNRGAERLTGIAAASVLDRLWSPTLINMRDSGKGPERIECPVAHCVETGVQSHRRLVVANRNKQPIAVDVHTVPVVSGEGTMIGATMLLHDASPEATLEEQCQNLAAKASQDPLTKVANRAEFDQTHQQFVQAHAERRLPCSLIMCDIDHFKSINDTYGHQAGDEVLRSFGHLLKSECAPGDLVARYGGEEFVLLCADCNNAEAARRAEHLRRTIGELPQPALNGNVVTVSFGVTEIQPGDTPASMLRRADRALVEAKRLGRNMVMQLGDGIGEFEDETPQQATARRVGDELVVQAALVTAVPLKIAIEKLRGWVVDHHAEVLSIKADRIEVQLDVEPDRLGRRVSDQRVPYLVELSLCEQRLAATNNLGETAGRTVRTRIQVAIRLKRARDRRNANAAGHGEAILAAIRCYMMATTDTQPPEPGVARRSGNVASLWLKAQS